ncbi:MAG TPA: metalloregulator ArsR/SmtB family transcription factor [Miltoncostaeaceae bacterium]|nr:metalloregulator ArsR/SmtB family transcription factor [Miltoncostaeaceae bacterium]
MSHGSHGSAVAIDRALASEVASAMQALATPSRVLILGRLRESACTVTELAAHAGMEASAVSHQLRLLRLLGLVVGERSGRTIVYALHDDHVGALLDQAVAHAEHVRLGLAATPGRAGAAA